MSGPGSTHDEIASHGRRGSAGVGRPSGALRLRRMIPYGIILVIGCLLLYQTGKFDYDRQAAGIGPDAWPKLDGSVGRVYRLGPGQDPQPVPVHLGVTDGAYTEVLRGDLEEGSAVIIGGGPRSGGADASGPSPNVRARPARLF